MVMGVGGVITAGFKTGRWWEGNVIHEVIYDQGYKHWIQLKKSIFYKFIKQKFYKMEK